MFLRSDFVMFDFNRYANLLDLGNQRREKLTESCKAYQLVREAAELASWITEKENMMVGEEVGEDLEQVEEMQKKFDDFQKVWGCESYEWTVHFWMCMYGSWFYNFCFFNQDLKANEARLQELNSIADRLTAMGRTEAAEKIREQIAVSSIVSKTRKPA